MEATLPSWQRFREQRHAEVDELIAANDRSRSQPGYRTVRSLAYLDWRYGAHPEIEYLVHSLEENGKLAGLLIARPAFGAFGLKALVITEILLTDSRPATGVRLLRSLLRVSRSDYLMAHFARSTVERSLLWRTGFLRAPARGYSFVARSLNGVTDDPALPTSWDLTLGELEIF